MVPNWEVAFFRDVALDFWRLAMTPEQTRAEADFLYNILRGTAKPHLLDVPCGNGRHALELARRGCRVTGVDISEEFIAEARAASASLEAAWIVSDMCHLPWNAEFDGAFCFGNSFGFVDAARARAFLQAIGRALRPGSRFAIETGMAAESILPTLLQKRWHQLGDMHVLSENQYHPRESRLDIQYTFIRNGKIETRPTSSYVLTVNEICRALEEAGLGIVDLLSSIGGEPYRLGNPRLIVIAEKS